MGSLWKISQNGSGRTFKSPRRFWGTQEGFTSNFQHTLHLTDGLIADLQRRGYEVVSNLDPAHLSAIVSFAVPGDVRAAHARLREAKVAVSLRESYIRVSPHGYNTEDEVLRVGEVLGNNF